LDGKTFVLGGRAYSRRGNLTLAPLREAVPSLRGKGSTAIGCGYKRTFSSIPWWENGTPSSAQQIAYVPLPA
jgi:hypothetical protein